MLAIYCRGMGLRNPKAHVHPKVIESTVWARGDGDHAFRKFDAVRERNTTLSGVRRQGYRRVTQSCHS